MSFKEYGNIIQPAAPQGSFQEYGEIIEPIPREHSLAHAPIKGAIKGAMQSTVMSPFHNVGPVPAKLGERLLEKFLPTQESPIEGALERAGKIGTSMITGGSGGLIRKGITSLFGGIAGEATKQFGGGEIAQDIAELSGMALPDLAKNIPAKKAQERIVGFLRNKGFSENEITPLIQSPEKLARFAKFASKGEKTNQLMRDIYQKFDNVYGSIREQGENLPGLAREEIAKFEKNFEEKLAKIPKFYRRQIKEEVEDLMNSQMKFTDFIDFDQAVNARIKGVEGGKAVLGTLKEFTGEAKKAISPQLADDMNLANELYRKRIDVSKHLRTKEIEEIIDLGEAATLFAGIADQNVGLIGKVIGLAGTRKLAREMLINPRLQNISKRMLGALKKNQIPIAQKLYEIFKKEAGKSDGEFMEILPDFLNHSATKSSLQLEQQ